MSMHTTIIALVVVLSQQCLQYWYTVYVSPSVPPLLPERVQGVSNQIFQLEGGRVSCTDIRVHFYCPFTMECRLCQNPTFHKDI